MKQFRLYLGDSVYDSVYADFDGYHVVITTDNGYGASNTIYLKPPVIEALINYWVSLKNMGGQQ